MKIFETSRGRPVAIDAVPEFCPLCGYPVGESRFYQHAVEEHARRVGWLVKMYRDMPATKISALLVERNGIRVYVVLLQSPHGGRPKFNVEAFPAYVRGERLGYRFDEAIASSV